jgi:peptide/nickel transport system permease protein
MIPPWPLRTGLRLAAALSSLLGLLLVTFVIGRSAPVDPVIAVVGVRASPVALDRVANRPQR